MDKELEIIKKISDDDFYSKLRDLTNQYRKNCNAF